MTSDASIPGATSATRSPFGSAAGRRSVSCSARSRPGRRATSLLESRREALDRVVELLLKRETIDGEDLMAVLGTTPVVPAPGDRPVVVAPQPVGHRTSDDG